MKLQSPPVPNFKWSMVSQLFGFNQQWYYGFGYPGHHGLDILGEYGSPILATHDGTIQSITAQDPSAGNWILLRSLDGTFSTYYLHLSAFNNISIGQTIKAGEIIGYMGNTGGVRSSNYNLEHPGTHLHFGVKIHGRKNEYNSYVDPTPMLFREGDRLPYKLVNDLWILSQGDNVSFLQTCLKLEFPDLPFEPIGYFGNQTRNAVSRFQAKYLLSPTAGYCGPKTRRVLNQRYSAY